MSHYGEKRGTVFPFCQVGCGMEFPRYQCENMQEFITTIHTMKALGFEVRHCTVTDSSLEAQMALMVEGKEYTMAQDEMAYKFTVNPRKFGVILCVHKSDDPSGVGCVTDLISLLGVTGRLGGRF